MFTKESASRGKGSPRVTGFYDEPTGSVQYVVADPETGKAALIDVVQDFSPADARASHDSAREILEYCKSEGLEIEWVLDTHPHADHLMASHWLKQQTGAQNGIGEKVAEVATLWRELYNLPGAFDTDAAFDRLFADGDSFRIGNLDVRVMLCPGHTIASVSYIVGDAAFVHDTFMHVDSGTSRADFPGGSSAVLYRTLRAILQLPDDTRLFVGHDYPPVGRRKSPAWESTVAEQRENNVHIGGEVSETDFTRLRDERDATLGLPDRMLYALQVNLRAGRMPDPESDGHSYFKIPANRF